MIWHILGILVAASGGLTLFAAANPPKRFLELAGGHNDDFILMRESWVRALADFLDEHANAACIRPDAPQKQVVAVSIDRPLLGTNGASPEI